MTKEPLGVCDRTAWHVGPHVESEFCFNWRPVEASAPHRCKRCGQPCSPTDICGDCMEKQIKQEASAPAAPPDTRTIQDVLRLHVKSSQDMYETYKRVGDVDGCKFQAAFTQGLERAIEVANNRDARQAAPKDQTQAAPDAELRELRARREELDEFRKAHDLGDVPAMGPFAGYRDIANVGSFFSEKLLDRRIADLDSRIAAREKELEGRTHAK